MNKDVDSESGDEPQASPGWAAIDQALAKIYKDREPTHWGTIVPMMLGGDDPLNGISAYRNPGPPNHLHYITYGFSELYEKESDCLEESGFGFELTFRLAFDNSDDEDIPVWPCSLLQNLAKYVFSTGNCFDVDHHLPLNSKIAIGEDTEIDCIYIRQDPELGEITTPFGRVKFLQIVGLTSDEYEQLKSGYFGFIEEKLAINNTLRVTDLTRKSILANEQTMKAMLATDPVVNQAEIYCKNFDWSESNGQIHLEIGAIIVGDFVKLLQHRVKQGERMFVLGDHRALVFQPGYENAWAEKEDVLKFTMTQESVDSLIASLKPIRGNYPVAGFEALQFSVIPVDIKAADSDEVVRTIG